MIFWGSAFVSGRILTATFHPFNVGLMRFGIASLVLIPFLFYKKPNFYKINFIQFLKVLVLALTGVFSYNYFFFTGLQYLEAGRSSVIIAMNPAITFFLAALFLGERLTIKKLTGILLAILGVLVVVSRGNLFFLFSEGFGNGELYLFGAVFSWVSYTILGKVFLKKLTSLEATTWACFLGTFILLPFALKSNFTSELALLEPRHLLHIANIGILTTCVGFIWYYDGIKKIGAAAASSFINLVPIVGIFTGAVFLSENVGFSLVFGSILVICGVFLVNRAKR